ncbi:MAG: hypothetical protein C4551_05665 [Bacillota bacterium]|nr:MAG: hypothetical protein C4551_05665 [Bacillota bacterium]
MLNRPHRLYLSLLVVWVGIVLFIRPEQFWSAAAVSIVIGILAAFYFQASSREFARRLLARALGGDRQAQAAYQARTRSRFGDIAREYLDALLQCEDERALQLVVRQLGHPDAQARELTEDRLARWGVRAAEPLVQVAIGNELSGDGAFRARRLLYRWRPELSPNLTVLLDTAGYWQT